MVHSALGAIARKGHDALDVMQAFVEYMSPGTLLMPTMSWRVVNPGSPYFDELATPSATGYLTELFRTKYATRRSLHPTHSVSGIGGLVDRMLSTHHLDETPCSASSPWGLLDDYEAHVLLLGVGMDCCTLIHHIEERVAPDLYFSPHESRERYICRDRHGKEFEVYTRRTLRLPRDFWQFQDMLAVQGLVRVAQIDGTACLAFRASDMVEVVTGTLRKQPDAIIAKPGQRHRMM